MHAFPPVFLYLSFSQLLYLGVKPPFFPPGVESLNSVEVERARACTHTLVLVIFFSGILKAVQARSIFLGFLRDSVGFFDFLLYNTKFSDKINTYATLFP